jgi:hypothetical protein
MRIFWHRYEWGCLPQKKAMLPCLCQLQLVSFHKLMLPENIPDCLSRQIHLTTSSVNGLLYAVLKGLPHMLNGFIGDVWETRELTLTDASLGFELRTPHAVCFQCARSISKVYNTPLAHL